MRKDEKIDFPVTSLVFIYLNFSTGVYFPPNKSYRREWNSSFPAKLHWPNTRKKMSFFFLYFAFFLMRIYFLRNILDK